MANNLKPYKVTFKTKSGIYCANVAMADSKQAVETYYSGKYGWCAVDDCKPYELETARRKGMPVKTIN